MVVRNINGTMFVGRQWRINGWMTRSQIVARQCGRDSGDLQEWVIMRRVHICDIMMAGQWMCGVSGCNGMGFDFWL